MKTRLALCPLIITVLFSLVSVGGLRAQSASPAPTADPTKSATPVVTPSPASTVAPAAKPEKPQRTAEEKAARKAERLRKYDTNKDGHLDASERAAMQADKAKASPTP